MKRVLMIFGILLILSTFFVLAQTNETNDNQNTTSDNQNTTSDNNSAYNNHTDNDDDSNDTNDTNETDDDSDETNETEDKIFNNKSEKWERRCNAANNRVAGRIKMYEEASDPHINRFNNLVSILEKVINSAKEKGFDTAALEEDLVKLKELINIFREDYAIFIEKLTLTRNFTCGHSEGQYKAALAEAKVQLKIVREDAEAIKEFFKTTIKEDIQALKEQIKLSAEDRKKAKDEKRSILAEERKTKIKERDKVLEQKKTEFQARVKEKEERLTNKATNLQTRPQNLERTRQTESNTGDK